MQGQLHYPVSLNIQSEMLNDANRLELSSLSGEKRVAEVPHLPSLDVVMNNCGKNQYFKVNFHESKLDCCFMNIL
jgi:hypothetical protein